MSASANHLGRPGTAAQSTYEAARADAVLYVKCPVDKSRPGRLRRPAGCAGRPALPPRPARSFAFAAAGASELPGLSCTRLVRAAVKPSRSPLGSRAGLKCSPARQPASVRTLRGVKGTPVRCRASRFGHTVSTDRRTLDPSPLQAVFRQRWPRVSSYTSYTIIQSMKLTNRPSLLASHPLTC